MPDNIVLGWGNKPKAYTKKHGMHWEVVSALYFDDNMNHVLVIDQTADDMSLQYGASIDTCIEMLESVIAETPQIKSAT